MTNTNSGEPIYFVGKDNNSFRPGEPAKATGLITRIASKSGRNREFCITIEFTDGVTNFIPFTDFEHYDQVPESELALL